MKLKRNYEDLVNIFRGHRIYREFVHGKPFLLRNNPPISDWYGVEWMIRGPYEEYCEGKI